MQKWQIPKLLFDPLKSNMLGGALAPHRDLK